MTLENNLQYFSVANKVSTTGFDHTPTISFTSRILTICINLWLNIVFPWSMGCHSYEDSRVKMDQCVLGSFGFGTAMNLSNIFHINNLSILHTSDSFCHKKNTINFPFYN